MRRRTGYTLLELLIGSALLSTLMLLVWSLFSTFTRLEERSSRKAVEIQLTRSVAQQLRSDVQHLAIPLVWPARKPDTERRRSSAEQPESNIDSEGEAATESDAATDDQGEAFTDKSEADNNDLASDTLDGDESTVPASNELQSSLRLDFGEIPDLQSTDLRRPPAFDSSLLQAMYFRGSANKLELIIRQPFTVDVPRDDEIIGSETRFGTHLFIIWEWKKERELASLLQSDPVLNPRLNVRPPAMNRFGQPNFQPGLLPNRAGQFDGTGIAPGMPNNPNQINAPPPTRLNPNDNVGLIREAKSWLHVTRDQRANALRQQAQSANLLIDGRFPWEVRPYEALPSDLSDPASELLNRPLDQLSLWEPPREFQHKRDHLPEVTRLQFRYSDGQSWSLDWSSSETLPKAIEVAFDLDPQVPATRAKEFEAAHAAMLSGESLEAVLPEDIEDTEADEDFDSLLDNNLLDPTAIAAEYRFIIRLPSYVPPKPERNPIRDAVRPDDAESEQPTDPGQETEEGGQNDREELP